MEEAWILLQTIQQKLSGSPQLISLYLTVSSASSSLTPTNFRSSFCIYQSPLLSLLGLLLDCSNLSILPLVTAVPPLKPSQSALYGVIDKTCAVPLIYSIIPGPVHSGHLLPKRISPLKYLLPPDLPLSLVSPKQYISNRSLALLECSRCVWFLQQQCAGWGRLQHSSVTARKLSIHLTGAVRICQPTPCHRRWPDSKR